MESAGESRELESPVGDLIGWVLVGSRLGNEELDELVNFDLKEANQDRDFESPVEDLEFRCLWKGRTSRGTKKIHRSR